MQFFVFKTNSALWDWDAKATLGPGGWGPIRANRDALSPGDVILMYDTKLKLVFAVDIAMGGFHESSWYDDDGIAHEGWFTNSTTLAIVPVEPTARELAAIKGLRGHQRITFKTLPEGIGADLYGRLMRASAERERQFYLSLSTAPE